MTDAAGSSQAGFSLVETLIAVALFALIGLAGFTLIDGILGVQRRTDQRLDHLAELQRAMHILTSDLGQVQAGSLTFNSAQSGITARRIDAMGQTGAISFDLQDGTLRRIIAPANGAPRSQNLVTDIGSLNWKLYLRGLGWQDAALVPPDRSAYPLAIAVEITLNELRARQGIVRRVVLLPQASVQ